MTKEKYEKECEKYGIICTSAFENTENGFDPDIAEDVVAAVKDTLASIDLDAVAKKMDDTQAFIKTHCNNCEFNSDEFAKECNPCIKLPKELQ